MISRSSLVSLCVPMFCLALAGCSDDGDDDGPGNSGSAASGNGAAASGGTAANGNGSGATGSGGTGPVFGVSGSGGSSGPGPGNGTPEVCDGVDNNENGVIDDVDAGNDGVCDCLNIATIGGIGPWNPGNVFETWLNARSPQGAVALADEELTAEKLAPHQVIVLLHVAPTAVSNTLDIDGEEVEVTAPAHHEFSEAEVAAFKAWVENGGGVMSTIGYTGDEASEVENVNRLLGAVGMGYSDSKLDLNDFITEWETHPVTAGVSNIYTQNGVEPDGGGTTLARGAGGRIALQVTQAEGGRVIVWGDEWLTYDSQWTDVATQQVELFWLNMLKWLSPPNECQVPIPPTVE